MLCVSVVTHMRHPVLPIHPGAAGNEEHASASAYRKRLFLISSGWLKQRCAGQASSSGGNFEPTGDLSTGTLPLGKRQPPSMFSSSHRHDGQSGHPYFSPFANMPCTTQNRHHISVPFGSKVCWQPAPVGHSSSAGTYKKCPIRLSPS